MVNRLWRSESSHGDQIYATYSNQQGNFLPGKRCFWLLSIRHPISICRLRYLILHEKFLWRYIDGLVGCQLTPSMYLAWANIHMQRSTNPLPMLTEHTALSYCRNLRSVVDFNFLALNCLTWPCHNSIAMCAINQAFDEASWVAWILICL